MPARRILVLHGPNLNLLDGARSVASIDAALRVRASLLGVELKSVQANWEGGLLDTLAAERDWFEAVIVNPATLAPSAIALAEAIRFLKRPAIEVQLDDAKKAQSALKHVVQEQISGKGPKGYLEALVALAPKGQKNSKPLVAAKSIGRRARSETSPAPDGVTAKTIGTGKAKRSKAPPPASRLVSRAVVRQQIADRLAGKITAEGLSAWARAQWQKLQSTPTESGQRGPLEDVLQQLLLSSTMKASDDQLIELMTQLNE